jgi:hypothetical protein
VWVCRYACMFVCVHTHPLSLSHKHTQLRTSENEEYSPSSLIRRCAQNAGSFLSMFVFSFVSRMSAAKGFSTGALCCMSISTSPSATLPVCVYVYIYIYTHTHIYICIHTHTHVCIYMHTRTHVCIHICTHTHVIFIEF